MGCMLLKGPPASNGELPWSLYPRADDLEALSSGTSISVLGSLGDFLFDSGVASLCLLTSVNSKGIQCPFWMSGGWQESELYPSLFWLHRKLKELQLKRHDKAELSHRYL